MYKQNVSPYLYPFIVEYSLIGAAFLYVMWSNIGRGARSSSMAPVNNGTADGSNHHQNHHPLQSPTSPGGFTIDNLSTSTATSGRSNHSLYSCLGSSKGPSDPLINFHFSHNVPPLLILTLTLFFQTTTTGLFSGFLFLVVSITSLIIFFVLIHHPGYHKLATVISEMSHSILLVFCSLATIIAYIKIRKLKFQPGMFHFLSL